MKTLDKRKLIKWNYKKNGDLKLENCRNCSIKKVWWKCRYGHEWKGTKYIDTMVWDVHKIWI